MFRDKHYLKCPTYTRKREQVLIAEEFSRNWNH